MKPEHYEKLLKELKQLEIIEESLGMIRLTAKFRELLVKNFNNDKPVDDNIHESIILSVLDVIGTAEHNQLSDYCCIVKGTLPNAL